MLSPFQQTIDRLQKSQNILIALPENLNGDSLGSALALGETLKNLNKNFELVSAGELPEKLTFLYGASDLKHQIKPRRDFIISINTLQNKITSLKYEQQNNCLKIFLATPHKIEEKDIKLEAGAFAYDLIVTIDAPDLESLGKIFEENTELFFQKPILNIDHKSANENFGEINLVEPKAAANAQIVQKILEGMNTLPLTPSQATALLCGLITKTHSFQNINTTPQALILASELINQGAERELIIQNLYKTKPLNRLRLFGRLLEKTEYDNEKKIVWMKASSADFAETASTAQELTYILEEINDFFPMVQLVFIFWTDENNNVWVLGQSEHPKIMHKMNLEFGGALKNNRWLAKTSFVEINQAKKTINNLLISLL